MTHHLKHVLCSVVVATVMSLCSTVDANPVSFEVGPFSTTGFSATWLHDASNPATSGYTDTGQIYYGLEGTLDGFGCGIPTAVEKR